ncbi:aspartate/glutamate racemase family protein [Tateyamaria omphalii]|uniref:aspartate/glutamate racemase family protein n=1 Tax=Tateyamaria omphalii TaxID=299262 RepID=UPI001C992598|nr:aspartate/glutamate racemase family protein [Tateyamaria omphalii]MBY5933908.1 aspartate/glutamate racemase family protein [Tateyamaria omphalii]
MSRIALIHATRVAIDPIEVAVRRHWPEVEAVSIMDEGLSVDRQASAGLSPALHGRIADLTSYAERMGADGILFTCSAFGCAIDAAAQNSRVPVLKPNEAMFDAAFVYGNRVAMIYTFQPARQTMEAEFADAARTRGSAARLSSYFCEAALDAKRAGDDASHDRIVAETARGIRCADVILLAQFSMSGAADMVCAVGSTPVLTAPDAAIVALRRRVEAGARQQAC